jgi:RNA polymerase sigma factor (sigma-70 family)
MSNQTTEKELMHRFRQGDAVAFNTFYNRYFSSLRFFSFRLINQKTEAEDIAIETFIKLFRLCGNFDTVINVRAFLYVTARNACYDYLSYIHRQPVPGKDYFSSYASQEGYSGIEDMRTEAVLKAIAEAIEGLPEECCKALKMTYVEGIKTATVAQLLSISEQAVRSYKRRSMQLLRIALFRKCKPEVALVCLSRGKTGTLTPIREMMSAIYTNTLN